MIRLALPIIEISIVLVKGYLAYNFLDCHLNNSDKQTASSIGCNYIIPITFTWFIALLLAIDVSVTNERNFDSVLLFSLPSP
jgi:hypothetical protein